MTKGIYRYLTIRTYLIVGSAIDADDTDEDPVVEVVFEVLVASGMEEIPGSELVVDVRVVVELVTVVVVTVVVERTDVGD